MNSTSAQLSNTINKVAPTQSSQSNTIGIQVPYDSVSTWEDYQNLATFTVEKYNISNLNKRYLNQIDSTELGVLLFKNFPLNSAYLVSINSVLGDYYPCVFLLETFHADHIEPHLMLCLIDSTMSSIGDYVSISSDGQEYATHWITYSEIEDSLLTVYNNTTFDCEELPEYFKSLKIKNRYLLTPSGEIDERSIDTLSRTHCTSTH